MTPPLDERIWEMIGILPGVPARGTAAALGSAPPVGPPFEPEGIRSDAASGGDVDLMLVTQDEYLRRGVADVTRSASPHGCVVFALGPDPLGVHRWGLRRRLAEIGWSPSAEGLVPGGDGAVLAQDAAGAAMASLDLVTTKRWKRRLLHLARGLWAERVARAAAPRLVVARSDSGSDAGGLVAEVLAAADAERWAEAVRSRATWLGRTGGTAVVLMAVVPGHPAGDVVVKLARDPRSSGAIRREHAALSLLAASGGTDLAPRPLDLIEVDGRAALVTSRCPGEPLDLWLGSSPSRRRLRLLMDRAAVWLATLHAIHVDEMAADVSWLPRLNAVGALLPRSIEQLRDAVATLEEQPRSPVMVHGDFWPGNLVRDRRALRLVDWEWAEPSPHGWFDVFHFPLATARLVVRRPDVAEHARSTVEMLTRWRSDVVPRFVDAHAAALRDDDRHRVPGQVGLALAAAVAAARQIERHRGAGGEARFWEALLTELDRAWFSR